MSIGISDLQSIISTNGNRIAELEIIRNDRKEFVHELKAEGGYNLDPLYKMISDLDKQIKKLANHQRILKAELKLLVGKPVKIKPVIDKKEPNFYINITDLEHSHAVQKTLFSIGYRWFGSGFSLEDYTNTQFTVCTGDRDITFGASYANVEKVLYNGKIVSVDKNVPFIGECAIYSLDEIDSITKTGQEIVREMTGIGDVNSQEKGSGARYNSGKPDLSLIPLWTLEDEARVWEYGKRKYAAWNWCKGMAWSVPYACLMRHMAKWQAGEQNDEESGLPHLAHAMCNLRMLTLYAKTYTEGDDRPPVEFMR